MFARLLSIALVTACAVVPGAAHAADGPAGAPCTFIAEVPQDNADAFGGVLLGGPYAADGTLTCTVQVGAPLHSGADSVSRSASGPAAVVAASVEVPWTGFTMFVCTQFTPAGGSPVYWDGAAWSASSSAPCVPYRDTVGNPADPCPNGCGGDLDSFICPVFRLLSPGLPLVEIRADGDIYVAGVFIWDCPPYNAT